MNRVSTNRGRPAVLPQASDRNVSEEVETMLARGTTKLRPHEPAPAKAGDWKSGERLWEVEVTAPFGGAEEMVKDLKANVFPSQEIKFLAMGRDGRKEVRAV